MVNRSTFRIGQRDVRAARISRGRGVTGYDVDGVTPAQMQHLSAKEKLVGPKWVPKWVQRLSYPTHNRVTGRKRIPLRLWSFSRGDVDWADYDQEIIKQKEVFLISQSPWVLVMSFIRLFLIPAVLLAFAFWLRTKHIGVVDYGPALLTLKLPLAKVFAIFIDVLFVLVALSVLWIPLRMWNRRVTWWTVYYVPIEAGILFYSGWWLPEPFLAQESNVQDAHVYYGIWPLKYFWGYLNVGDIIFYGQDNQEIARMRKIRDPEGCFSVIVEPLLLSTERSERRAADFAEITAGHERFRSRLTVLLAQRGGSNVTDEELAALAVASGLDPAEVGLLTEPPPEVSTEQFDIGGEFPENT